MCGGHDPRDKKEGSTIYRKIKVGVITIRPKECVLNSSGELLRHDALIPSANRSRCPGIKPSNIKDVVLFKVAGNTGGGAFKLLINPVYRPRFSMMTILARKISRTSSIAGVCCSI